MLDRGERIEVLVDKTEDLHNQSQSFKKKGTQLKRKMWWKNAKLCCCLITILIVIVALITFGILSYLGVFSWLPNIFGNKTRSTTGSSTTGTTTGIATTGAALLETFF